MSRSKRDQRGHSTGDNIASSSNHHDEQASAPHTAGAKRSSSEQTSTPHTTSTFPPRPRPPRSDRFNIRQLSRVDWGSVRDLKDSLVGIPFGSFVASGTGTPGSSMAEAAAAASYSYNDGVSGAHLDGSGSDRYAPSSRYDPNTMKRIVDINDLAESDGDSDATEATGNGGRIARKKQKNQGLLCRRTLVIIASIGVIVGASLGIRALVINNQNSNPKQHSTSSASFQVQQQQRLLEIAEEVVWACSERTLNEDMSHCQDVCHGQLCCVDEEREYSCEDDESRNCAVYAGCRALVEGLPANENAAVTSVGRMTNKWG